MIPVSHQLGKFMSYSQMWDAPASQNWSPENAPSPSSHSLCPPLKQRGQVERQRIWTSPDLGGSTFHFKTLQNVNRFFSSLVKCEISIPSPSPLLWQTLFQSSSDRLLSKGAIHIHPAFGNDHPYGAVPGTAGSLTLGSQAHNINIRSVLVPWIGRACENCPSHQKTPYLLKTLNDHAGHIPSTVWFQAQPQAVRENSCS